MVKRVLGIFIILALLASSATFLFNSWPATAEDEPCDECQQSQAEGELQYPIMRPSPETLRRWIEEEKSLPEAYISPQIRYQIEQLPETYGASFSLLDHLQYTPSERNQGACGNCWVWAGTGIMEIALDVQRSIEDRLSIQYLNSNYEGGSGDDWACCGGLLSYLADFYDGTGKTIPWSNTNADWQDVGQGCGGSTTVPAGTISTTPYYPITSIGAQTIPTKEVGEATAIANIQNVLNQDKGVWFSFYMAESADWSAFFNFWGTQGEDVIWDPDYSCGHEWSGGGAHAVLCVGYNDDPGTDNDYWIMLNSWGTTPGRPNGLFRVDMHMDYDCFFYYPSPDAYYSFYWETLDIAYPSEPMVTSVDPSSAGQGQTLDATIAGVNFNGTTDVSFGAGITINSYTVDSFAQITANITIAGGATLGTRDVSVTTPEGTGTLTDGFAVVINDPPNAPASPLCEGTTNPSWVTDPTPELSWTFSDPDGSDTQRAYQILVASSSGNLTADNGDMWDSTKVSGDASEVSYAGTTLTQNQTYYWKVKTWDNHAAEGPYCGEQQFTTGASPTEVWVDDDWAGSSYGDPVGGAYLWC